jgi:hypothetical protein
MRDIGYSIEMVCGLPVVAVVQRLAVGGSAST